MFDWIGSLRIREHTPVRVVLALSRSTQILGAILVIGGGAIAYRLWPISPWLALGPLLAALLGLLLCTLHRELVVDREAGILRVDQRAFGIGSQAVVPLFHLRAVVIVSRLGRFGEGSLIGAAQRWVAYIDRRVGDAIYLDESRRCAGLLELAQAIAEVAEVRLEYDATPPAAAGRDN
jgi:uncharacterized membrane protein